jgi:hypothetical protein
MPLIVEKPAQMAIPPTDGIERFLKTVGRLNKGAQRGDPKRNWKE